MGIPLGRAVQTLEPVLDVLRAQPAVRWAHPAGAVRRGEEFVDRLAVVVATDAAPAVFETLISTVEEGSPRHDRDSRFITVGGHEIQIVLDEPSVAEVTLLMLTGPATHVDDLRRRAILKGLALTSRGLQPATGGAVIASTEPEIYGALDLPFMPPEIRQGDEEFAAARRGGWAPLVERRDIRGDLHMHSQWSDGRDSIEAMVQAAIAMGYEYIAITDHSPRSAAAHNLTVEGVGQQADEIARLRTAYPRIAILHGCEVDILESGELDFEDRILERFDIVLASLHAGCGHDGERLLERASRALRHPLVTVLTHPTNRLFPIRPGYDLDYDRLFDLAAETGTAVEVDGAPSHLDLTAPLARRAVARGATLIISSDAHRTDALSRNIQLGLLTARRAWVEPQSVLNTRPLAGIRAAIAAKRA